MTHRGPFQPLLFCDSVILFPILPRILSLAKTCSLSSSNKLSHLLRHHSGILFLLQTRLVVLEVPCPRARLPAPLPGALSGRALPLPRRATPMPPSVAIPRSRSAPAPQRWKQTRPRAAASSAASVTVVSRCRHAPRVLAPRVPVLSLIPPVLTAGCSPVCSLHLLAMNATGTGHRNLPNFWTVFDACRFYCSSYVIFFFKPYFQNPQRPTHTNEHKKMQGSTKEASPRAQRPRPQSPEQSKCILAFLPKYVAKQRFWNLSKDVGKRTQVLGYIKFFHQLKTTAAESESSRPAGPKSPCTPLAHLLLTATAAAKGIFLTCNTRELYPLKLPVNLGQ